MYFNRLMNLCIIIITVLMGNVCIIKACTTQTTVPCSSTYQSQRTISVNGLTPTGSCTLITIGSTNFIFDPITINAVWITLSNTPAGCTDVAAKATSLNSSINYSAGEIVILNLTENYLRIVLVPKSCSPFCLVIPFPSDLEDRLSSSSLQLYPTYNNLNLIGQYCLNGGTINTNYTGAGYQCNCGSPPSAYYGPNCQYMEGQLQSTLTYFNIFSNPTSINIMFSLFSNGITGTQNILAIKGPTFKPIVQVIVSESTVYLYVLNVKTNATISLAIDNQIWYDFSIAMSQQVVTLTVNSYSNSTTLTSVSLPVDFRSYYLMFNATLPTATNQICIKNIIVNSVILDLNIPRYSSCCTTRCQCSANQICACRPFVSKSTTVCFCKLGYSGVSCTNSTALSFSSLPSAVTGTGSSTVPTAVPSVNIPNVPTLSQIDFGFQTNSANGILFILTISPLNTIVALKITNSNLEISVDKTLGTIPYNVANGVKHVVTLIFTSYSIVTVLDNNYNYTTTLLNWFNLAALSPATSIKLGAVTLGPMMTSIVSPLNPAPSTCFSDLQLNMVSDTGNATVPLGNASGVTGSCSNGSSCVNVGSQCQANSVCNDSQWQNVQCLCIANFTNVNLTCVYFACVPNPCVNGQCFYNSQSNTYGCSCIGTNCNLPLTQLWWIAVLVVLFLLLVLIILLLVYFCCIGGAGRADAPNIIKTHENIVVYNEQAGESDYTGPPINFAMMKKALYDVEDHKTPVGPPPAFLSQKDEFDKNNKDLILDHPLEYGFEGDNSYNGSISSIGSRSGGSELDLPALDNPDGGLNDLKQLFD